MRVIERKMIDAIKARKNFRLANTEVEHRDNGVVDVRLHGRLIATLGSDSILVSNGNYPLSRTTKSRLNAILESFVDSNAGIYTRRGTHYIQYLNQPKAEFVDWHHISLSAQ